MIWRMGSSLFKMIDVEGGYPGEINLCTFGLHFETCDFADPV